MRPGAVAPPVALAGDAVARAVGDLLAEARATALLFIPAPCPLIAFRALVAETRAAEDAAQAAEASNIFSCRVLPSNLSWCKSGLFPLAPLQCAVLLPPSSVAGAAFGLSVARLKTIIMACALSLVAFALVACGVYPPFVVGSPAPLRVAVGPVLL